MKSSVFFKLLLMRSLVVILCVGMAMPFTATSAMAAPGDTITTPTQPTELPIEIETELAPGSLKQAPLWKELEQLLDNPYLI